MAGRAPARSAEHRRSYSLRRVGLLILVSFGLYYFYWLGVSWKHLSTETRGRDHYPFGHAMAMVVPIYGLYILYDHFRTIKRLQSQAGVTSNLSPGWIVAIGIAWQAVTVVGNVLFEKDVSYLIFLTVVPPAAIGLWGQANLNRYWYKVSEGAGRPARWGIGEIAVAVPGGMLLGLITIGYAFPPQPGVASVYDAGPIIELIVDQEITDVIESNFDADAFSFQALQGDQYIIRTRMGRGDPLEDSLLFLWDTDGSTVLEVNDDYGGSYASGIEWTAPTSDVYYLTVENANAFDTGAYTLVVTRAGR